MKNYTIQILSFHKNVFKLRIDAVEHSGSSLTLAMGVAPEFISEISALSGSAQRAAIFEHAHKTLHKTIQLKWDIESGISDDIFSGDFLVSSEPVLPEPEGPNVVYRK